jgi:hypothetical protein
MSADAPNPFPDPVPGFRQTLFYHGLVLDRKQSLVCQMNLGLLGNQACSHCHLCAGPDRREIMTLDTMKAVMAFVG